MEFNSAAAAVTPIAVQSFDQGARCTPITGGGNFARTAGFAVALVGSGTQTTGAVRRDQPRALDLPPQNARKLGRVPPAIIDEVLARLAKLFE